jgi:formate hydrogenlyase subunit 6/NADH:ubiquinone oxidoreductase subunit I
MLITVLKNLISPPVTRRYPFKDIREPVKGYRGKLCFDENSCIVCGACARLCPTGAIEVNRQSRQITYYPFKCIYCGACMDGCSKKSITQDGHYTAPETAKSVETITVPAHPVSSPKEVS